MTQSHEQEALTKLIDRIGSSHAGKRLEMQAHYSAILLSGHHIHVHMEEFPAIAWLLIELSNIWFRSLTSRRHSMDFAFCIYLIFTSKA
jgi:hypothetical protein